MNRIENRARFHVFRQKRNKSETRKSLSLFFSSHCALFPQSKSQPQQSKRFAHSFGRHRGTPPVVPRMEPLGHGTAVPILLAAPTYPPAAKTRTKSQTRTGSA